MVKIQILIIFFLSFNVLGITVNKPDGKKNIILTEHEMARITSALQHNDMKTVKSIINIQKPEKPPKSVELRKFNPVNGYYEAQQQIEQQVIEELPAAFVNHEQYVAQQTKVKLSKACENRLDKLIQRLNTSSNNKKEQLKRYINEYTQQCEDEAKKLVDKKQ